VFTPDLDIFHPGSRDQKSTGFRIRIPTLVVIQYKTVLYVLYSFGSAQRVYRTIERKMVAVILNCEGCCAGAMFVVLREFLVIPSLNIPKKYCHMVLVSDHLRINKIKLQKPYTVYCCGLGEGGVRDCVDM
jgi:hypothetical protein